MRIHLPSHYLTSVLTFLASLFEKVIWVLKKATKSAAKSTAHYLAHPSEAWEDLVAYAKENPKEFALSCALITAGVLVIVVPLIIGFGPAGPILGTGLPPTADRGIVLTK